MKFLKQMSLAVCLLLDNKSTEVVQAREYINGMNPGMALRLEQSTVDAFKRSVSDFLPHYVYQDMLLPTYKKQTISMFFDMLQWTIEWKDIKYSVPKFDIDDVVFNMVNDMGIPKIVADFPVLQEWKVNALQSTDSIWIPDESPVELCFNDFDVDFAATVTTNQEGNLKPHFWSIHLKFGDSYFTHDNWFFAFTFHQTLKFAMIVVENTAFICGELILSEMGEPLLTQMFNQYKMPFGRMPTPFLGQGDVRDDFIMDWRLTHDPVVEEGQMDLFFHGEVYQTGSKGCGELEPDEMTFLGDTTLSQFVISEAAASCLMNELAKSNIGKINLNEERLNALFNVTDIKFDTTSFAKYIPTLKNKIGANKPLKVKASISHVDVRLGLLDSDVRLEYTLNLGWYTDLLGSPELLYDEIRMVTAFNMETHNDIVNITITDNKIKMDAQFGGKQAPIRNNIKMLNNEYREFLTQYGYSAFQMMHWMNNDIFKGGVKFPYRPDEFITNIAFADKTAHMMFIIEAQMEELLEEKLW